MTCTTHHNACDCREEKFKKMQLALDSYRETLETVIACYTSIARKAIAQADKLLMEK